MYQLRALLKVNTIRGVVSRCQIKPPLSEWQKTAGTLLFGSLAPDAKPLKGPYPSPIIIVIGPEKGLSPEEHRTLETKLHGTGVSLHPNILRAETAALCALSRLSQQ